eukprot:GHVQ01006943.1.p1 GENE.GHVQ01006943.1~~GHVQ01006943.1.p1  ORF type:complete len:103 (-),score=13.96 GHVQ01006943.1:198-506(-)
MCFVCLYVHVVCTCGRYTQPCIMDSAQPSNVVIPSATTTGAPLLCLSLPAAAPWFPASSVAVVAASTTTDAPLVEGGFRICETCDEAGWSRCGTAMEAGGSI